MAVAFRSEEEVSWRRGPPVTYFGPALDPPLGGSGRKTTTLVRDHEYFIPTKFHQNPSSGSGEEVENVKVYGRTTTDGWRTDNGRCAMTIAHLSLWLRWAKKDSFDTWLHLLWGVLPKWWKLLTFYVDYSLLLTEYNLQQIHYNCSIHIISALERHYINISYNLLLQVLCFNAHITINMLTFKIQTHAVAVMVIRQGSTVTFETGGPSGPP